MIVKLSHLKGLMIIGTFVASGYLAPATLAQQVLTEDQSDELEAIISQARDKSTREKIKALNDAVELIRRHANGKDDLLETAIILEIEADRLGLYTDEFKELVNRVKDPKTTDLKRLTLREMRLSLVAAVTNLMQLIAKDGIDARDAGQLLKLAKSASQLVDDLNDVSEFSERGSFDGAKSKISKFLSAANGIASLTDGIKDPDANKLMSGFQDTIGSISFKAKALGVNVVNPVKAIEYPAAVAAAQIEVTRQGFEDVTETLGFLTELMDNDNTENRRHLLHSLDNVKKTLSGENYGNKMLDALMDKTASRLPFLRTLRAWGSGNSTGVCEVKELGPLKKGQNYATLDVTDIVNIFGNIKDAGTTNFISSAGERHSAHDSWPGNTIPPGSYHFGTGSSSNYGINFYPTISCSAMFKSNTLYHVRVREDKYGMLDFVFLKSSPKYRLSFKLFSSSGKYITQVGPPSLSGLPHLLPGTYTLRPINDSFGIEIDKPPLSGLDLKYNVSISAGTVTKFELPKIRCKNGQNGQIRSVCVVVK